MSESPSVRARRRVREEIEKRGLSQNDVANLLKWSESRVSKLLNGKIELGLDDLAALCFAVDLSLVEAVRDQGLEFCADMTPTELRILQRLRESDKTYYEAVLTVLGVRQTLTTTERYASKPVEHNKLGKPRPR